eukprot:TCALIF_12276-PA protein Name:"Similar to SASH3 SAM and SH3 domain-containing protein 3 (Bos taurus)" AED:0.20 eAED:0.20 QI:110/1/1/1/0.6/0.83/6/59/865
MPLLVCGKGAALPLSSASIVPEVPYRNGVTVRVKDENNPNKSHNTNNNNNSTNINSSHGSVPGAGNPSSGSHRVLLKLRRMSGGGSSSSSRPKSVPDSSELLDGVVNGSAATFANLADLKLGSNGSVDQQKGSNCKSNKPSKMKSSKSLHHFYNKTWNEKSLSKFLRHDSSDNQHNYENIYNSDKESSTTSGSSIFGSSATNSYHPVYENMYLRTTACFSSLNPTINNNNDALKINQLTQSPTLHARAARNRDRNRPLGGSTDQDRASNSQTQQQQQQQQQQPQQQQKPLFRSKSCERPKMRDAVRDTLKNSSDKFHSNLSRFSSKFGHSPTISNFSQVDGECDNYSILAKHPYSNASSAFDEDPENQHGSLSLGPGMSLQSYLGEDHKSLQCQNHSMDEEKASILSSSSSSAASVNRPSLSLAHKMKGFRQDVQKRISRLRSRSAERISQRSTVNGGRSPDRSFPQPPESPRVSGGHILPSPTLTGQETIYTGPFLGRARALVDYTPSPYDKDALRFKRGDVIDVISMNPSGLWKGKCENRVGNFKFINVEILPQPRSQSQPRAFRESPRPPSHSERAPPERETHKKDFGNPGSQSTPEDWRSPEEGAKVVNRPKTVDELLRKIGLEEHISVFVLNGYEELDSFQDMDEAELDYLGITNDQHRAKLMTAVQLLQDSATIHSGENSDIDVGGSPTKSPHYASRIKKLDHISSFQRLSFPRDSGCFESNENISTQTRSSPASDRSSHSGVSSHPESGIHLPEGTNGSLSLSSSDDDTITSPHHVTPVKRSAEKAAKARSLRDRRTVNMDELDFPESGREFRIPSGGHRGQGRASFDALVAKYSETKKPSFEMQFQSARRVFERCDE